MNGSNSLAVALSMIKINAANVICCFYNVIYIDTFFGYSNCISPEDISGLSVS